MRFRPGRMLGAAAQRLRGLRYFLSDLLFVIARFPRAVGRGIAGFWRSMSVVTRRRLVAAVGVAAAAFVFSAVIVPNLPCALPGGDECPPDDEALELAPASTVAYLHVNLDPETEQAEVAGEVASRMPQVSQQVIGQVTTALGVAPLLGAAGEGWFAGEAAAVLIGGGAAAERVQMLETSDADAARAYAESIASGVPQAASHREVEIAEDDDGNASAVVEDFLVIGPRQGVRAVIDVATGAEGAESLAGSPVATEALDALPEHRVAEAFLSADGIAALVAAEDGPLASFEPLIGAGASRGAALSLSAGGAGFSLASRSVVDSERDEAEPGFFAAFEGFEPRLPEQVAPDALAYLGLGEPGETITALLRQATVRAPGIAAGFTDLLESLRGAADVDLQRDLLESLGGEAAFSVVPREPVDPDAEIAPTTPVATPYLEFLADEVDEERAREALARLQGPIARSFDPELGAPNFQQRKFGDLDAEVLRLSPVALLIYALLDSQLVIANDPQAVERLVGDDDDGLDASDRYEDTVDPLPDKPALIAYLDLRNLLVFAERSGLGEDTVYAAFAPDLRRLSSFGVTVSEDNDVLAGDARVLID